MTVQQLSIASHLALCDHIPHRAIDGDVVFVERCILPTGHDGDHLPGAWMEDE